MPTKPNIISVHDTGIDDLIIRARVLSGLASREEIISKAVQLLVEHLEKESETTGKSFFELTSQFAGSVEGPSDLAHNKKYLQGFGK